MTATVTTTGRRRWTLGSLDCQPRWATPRSPDRPTYGGKVAEIAAAIGKPLMPWQRLVADVALEYDPVTRIPAYREVIVHVMRQQGKTTLQLPVITHRCIGFRDPQHATYAAQSGVAARQKLFDEHWPLLQASPLGKLVRPRRQSGHEALLWKNGSRHSITTGTEKAGHGLTLDLPVIDEAFAYKDPRLEQAFVPAMQTRPLAQLWIMSTAGTEDSVYLRSKVEMGRARVEGGLRELVAYFEWSIADDEDPFDPAVWRRRMPALGRTTSEREIAAAAASMEEREYRRAFGNQWLLGDDGGSPFDMARWLALEDQASEFAGPVAFGVEMSLDRRWTSVGAVGPRSDGLLHVEIVENREGTSWAPRRLQELVERWRPAALVVDPGGPAGSLVADLRELHVPFVSATARDVTQACGGILDAAMDAPGRLRHLGQAELTGAVRRARLRTSGDAARWDPRKSGDDISPLSAVTLAWHGWTTYGAAGSYDLLQSVW